MVFSVSTKHQRIQYAFLLQTFQKPATVNITVNITKQQEKALQNLRKDETIKIIPVNKGRSIVVMDSDEYKEKVSVLLTGITITLSEINGQEIKSHNQC